MIIGIYGHHDSGKTLFLEKIIKELRQRGISAAAVKHLGGHYKPDTKKDTGRLAKAGFDPVIGVADGEATIRLSGHDDLRSAISLMQTLSDPDVIFVEGFKNEPIEKIAVGDIEELPGTLFRSDDVSVILEYITRKVKEEQESTINPCGCEKTMSRSDKHGGVDDMAEVKLEILVNGKKIAANEFVNKMVWETLSGMMRSLKQVDENIKSIEISARKE